MEEIQIGEYVRTRRKIGKLIRIERDDIDTSLKWYVLDDGRYERYVNKPYIEKHSKNILDLIEVKDIIRYDINTALELLHCVNEIEDEEMLNNLKNNKDVVIKSIVTKEQFASMEYKIESEE